MKRIILIILSISFLKVSAQNSVDKQSLQVVSFIQNERVLIRWAPDNPISWQRGNHLGYTVYRRTVMRDGKVVQTPDSILIGKFKPEPLEVWRPYADSSYYAVAAEAIYGSGFEVTTKASNSFLDIVNKSREQESRYSIGLLCADRSFSIAKMMGLGLEDLSAKKNEAYVYKVVLNHSDSAEIQEIGFVMADYSYGNFLPRPFGVSYEVNQNVVTVLVPYEPFKGIYNTYELQRSDDGEKFRTVKDASFYSFSSSPDDPKYSVYNDSVISKASTVFYRLRGRTSFDVFGPFSDTLEVKIMPSLRGEPWITDIKEVGNGKLIIAWETPGYKSEDVKGFMLYSSNKYEGPYLQLLKEPVAKSAGEIDLDAPSNYAYFKIGAIDQFNRSYLSSPRLYQVIDSIPPSLPSGLTGFFDTTGIVNFKWNYGKERDLLGYQLLYSANDSAEYSLVSKSFIYDSTYSTKFPLGLLSSDLFFKIVAIDTRYNTSSASESIKLVKPDTISPSAPVIFIVTDSVGIARVSIAPSQSSDIKLHRLCFEPESDKSKKKELFIGTVKTDTSIVLPDNIGNGKVYCVAEDITNRKRISNSVKVGNSGIQNQQLFNVMVKLLVDEGAVKLIWDSREFSGNVMVYRKDAQKGYSLVETIDSHLGWFLDKNVVFNTNYCYKLVACLKSGKAVSRVVMVEYK